MRLACSAALETVTRCLTPNSRRIFLPTPDKSIEAAFAYVHEVARIWGFTIITSAPAPA